MARPRNNANKEGSLIACVKFVLTLRYHFTKLPRDWFDYDSIQFISFIGVQLLIMDLTCLWNMPVA